MFVIHRIIGVPIFHSKFQDIHVQQDDKHELDEDLIAGGMVGITAMLKEISQSSEELKIIDHSDQIIMLDHGENFFIALMVVEK